MSLAQISPSRSFTSPFRFSGSKKATPATDDLRLLARSFDDNLLRRLKTLAPDSRPPPITLSWLAAVVDCISSTHAEARSVISGLSLSVLDEPLARYLSESVKLLDICNRVSSEIERLSHRRLLVNVSLHLIDASATNTGDPAPEKLRRARELLADRERGFSERSGWPTAEALIRDLAADLGRAPRRKLSGSGKLVCRTFHAVGLVTVFLSGVLVSAVFGSGEAICSVRAPAEFPWAELFNGFVSSVNGELTRRLGSGKGPAVVVREIAEADFRVRRLCVAMDAGGGDAASEALEEVAKAARGATASAGLDGLGNGVEGLFRTVLENRNGMVGAVWGGEEATPVGKTCRAEE